MGTPSLRSDQPLDDEQHHDQGEGHAEDDRADAAEQPGRRRLVGTTGELVALGQSV
jgi:hypothetical protein